MALYHPRTRRHVINIKQDIGKSCILTYFAFTVAVDLLLNVLSIICGSSVFVFVLLCIICVQSSFAIIIKRKRKLVALLLFLQMYFYYKCSFALLHHAVGWSAVCDCDCGIS